MVKVDKLTSSELECLEKGYRNDIRHHYRQRCKGILLSNDGFSVSEIALILKKQKDTIYGWIKSYKSSGIDGLENKEGQGVKSKLDDLFPEQEERIKELLGRDAQNMKKICGILSDEFGFRITKWMLSHFIKKNGIIHGVE